MHPCICVISSEKIQMEILALSTEKIATNLVLVRSFAVDKRANALILFFSLCFCCSFFSIKFSLFLALNAKFNSKQCDRKLNFQEKSCVYIIQLARHLSFIADRASSHRKHSEKRRHNFHLLNRIVATHIHSHHTKSL